MVEVEQGSLSPVNPDGRVAGCVKSVIKRHKLCTVCPTDKVCVDHSSRHTGIATTLA